MRSLLLCLFVVLLLGPVRGAEPFFKKGDVIALVGGEDMVVASEYGYLELLLTRALPDYKLRFRNLAWEGDTVFEQRRDLNFPSYEEQLDKIGATVVIAQFGQMESLAAAQEPRRRGGAEGEKAAVTEFIAAYEKLIERFSAGGKRRVLLISPIAPENLPVHATPERELQRLITLRYVAEIRNLGLKNGVRFIDVADQAAYGGIDLTPANRMAVTRDGFHLSESGFSGFTADIAHQLKLTDERVSDRGKPEEQKHGGDFQFDRTVQTLRQLIIAKNRLWFDYWRPQNWAFLAGDRTAQPSSRDHLDPSKRWFPPEREAFLPLIEAKEKQIDALAAQLAAGNAGK